MPWTIGWLDSQEQVVELVPHDPWNWEEFRGTIQRAREMSLEKPHTVDMICNLGDDLKLPKPAEGAPAPWIPLRDAVLQSPSNRGLVVLVAAPLFIESIVRNLKSIMKDENLTGNIRFVSSLREALKVINEDRDARGDALITRETA